MGRIDIAPLVDDLPFGARIRGIGMDNVNDEAIKRQINEVFNDRGMILFEDVEPNAELQVGLSEVFGPLQDHALKDIPRTADEKPGLVQFDYVDIFEVNGQELSAYVPWHFDACYTGELNRGGVLRAISISPEGGLTGFADGIQLYNDISPGLRARFEKLNILYHSHLMFMNMRFGRPASYNPIKVIPTTAEIIEATKDAPRSVHPAIWRRATGDKVLHVSPWQAAGIEGMETPEGDALLEDLCHEMYAKMRPYHHAWKPTDMVIWDNWRFIHSVGGHPPQYPRRMQRTTIQGDYGLGRMEKAGAPKPLGMNL